MPPKHGPWFPPLETLYGDRPSEDDPRELFQGDIFRDVPSARFPATEAKGEDPVMRHRMGLAMVVGHPCEISPTEKGAALPWRTMCAVVPDENARLTLDGEGHFNAFPLPDLLQDGAMWYADLRYLTLVHNDWLTPARRVASLSFAGWQAFQRRLIYFLTRVEMHPADIAVAAVDESGRPLHPDHDPAPRDTASVPGPL